MLRTVLTCSSSNSRIRNTAVYGGAPKGPQIRNLQRGVEVVIAHAGSPLRHVGIPKDEPSPGHLPRSRRGRPYARPQIRKIIGQIRPDRQTLMFSATWPKDVQRLATVCSPLQLSFCWPI